MQSKSHLLLLDALRGVAALIVLWFHCNEGFGYEVAGGTGIFTQTCDHGYLAVDFFFLLSGFVIGYAYDDRWSRGLSIWTFFRRRLIRLHPMVIAGAITGIACFIIGGCVNWSGEVATPGNMLVAFVLALLLVPTCPGMASDVRANGEMFPLNGPTWSLWFEYIGNILYAILLRRLPNLALALVVVVTGCLLSYNVITSGTLCVGWSFLDGGFVGGMTRLLFPYSLGMLLARMYMKHRTSSTSIADGKGRRELITFIICAASLLILLPIPFVGDPHQPWQNGLYILFLVMLVFPAIVLAAASASRSLPADHPSSAATPLTTRLYTFLGELSYPLYAVHYPIMYLFFQYIGYPNVTCTITEVWPVASAAFLGSIVLATIYLYCYDKPIRRRL